MTSKRLVSMLRELTPTEFSDTILLMWISNCENTILEDVLLASPEDCVELTELNEETMLVPHPWDKLYLPYMQAQVAHANGEYDHYANYITLYNTYLAEYTRHIIDTVCPSRGEAMTKGYYLSAYAIAVEHGYSGSVEEWLESLQGKQGPQGLQGPPGPQGEPGKTQFDDGSAEKLNRIASNFTGLSGSTIAGVPISYPGKGIMNAEILRTDEEAAANQAIKLVSSGKVKEMIRKDVTADYAAWTPESGTAKNVYDFVKTLADGSYSLYGSVYADIITVDGVQWRTMREYTDEFLYFSVWMGDSEVFSADTESMRAHIAERKVLTDYDIPLPTSADIGKILTASAAGKTVWTDVMNAEEVAV